MIRAALLAAAALLAPAQDSDQVFRLLSASPQIAAAASVEVTGPRTARSLTGILISAEVRGGADHFVIEMRVDCDAGTIAYLRASSWRGDEHVRDRDMGGTPERAEPDTVNAGIIDFACTGRSPAEDPTLLNG